VPHYERGGFERYRGGKSGDHRGRGEDVLTHWKSRISRDYDPTEVKVSITDSKKSLCETNATSGSVGSANDLRTQDVLAEFSRTGSGPAKTATTYLAGETKLEYVVRAVLFAKGISTEDWERYRSAVEEALEEWSRQQDA
jgi:hypothetical protein